MNILTWADKSVSELIPLTVDFSDRLQFGESINGASVSVSVYSGTDANPSALLSGTVSHTSTTVSQNITGGVAGVIYNVVFIAAATNSHNYVKIGHLAVISDSNPY